MTEQYDDDAIRKLCDAIREAVGAKPGETIEVYAPPHRERCDGVTVDYFPFTNAEFDALRKLTKDALIRLGLRQWDESGLMLFPFEWYGLIPDGFEVVDIFGYHEKFERGRTDDDCRFGVLAFGIYPADATRNTKRRK